MLKVRTMLQSSPQKPLGLIGCLLQKTIKANLFCSAITSRNGLRAINVDGYLDVSIEENNLQELMFYWKLNSK